MKWLLLILIVSCSEHKRHTVDDIGKCTVELRKGFMTICQYGHCYTMTAKNGAMSCPEDKR